MKLIYGLASVILLLTCSAAKSQEVKEVQDNFSGTITLTSGKTDSVYVGLYYYDSYNRNHNGAWLADPHYFAAVAGNEFSFNADPGRYTLVAFAYGYESVKKRVFIPDHETVLTANITLVPIKIKSEIKTIKLVGDFCEWKSDNALALKRKDKKWIVDSEAPIKTDETYQFLIDGVPRNDLANKNYLLRKDHADFFNIYKGGPIEFDPTIYAQSIERSSAELYGSDLLEQYNQFSEEFRDGLKSVSPILRNIRKSEPEEWEEKYTRIVEAFEPIEKKYDPILDQMLIEWRLSRFYLHPMMYDYMNARQDGKIDSVQLDKVIQSQIFSEFLSTQLELLNALDPTSYLLEGDFYNAVVFLDRLLKDHPETKRKQNLPDDYFYNFLIQFVKKSPKKTICTHVLYHSASDYAEYHEVDKTVFLINWLKNDYSDPFYVGEGHADKILASLHISEGKIAPDFAVQTLDGNEFKLSDFKGKFLFMDFWGTWCGPCLVELPNTRKLAQFISTDTLEIIGLVADDKEKKLREFLENDPLPYKNAIASEEVLKTYGINSFPTTLLIGPKGRILAKDLRGTQLVDLVKEKIDHYK